MEPITVDTLDELVDEALDYRGATRIQWTTPEGVTIEANPRHQWSEQIDTQQWQTWIEPAILAYRGPRFYGIRAYAPSSEDDIRFMVDEVRAEARGAHPLLIRIRDAAADLTRAEERVTEARTERDEAIRAARDHGERVDDIAAAAGIGRAAYYKIMG